MYTLVLVEDDYQIRTGLSRFFPWRQLGFELLQSFENGQKALLYLKENPVDVVLTDIRMPVLDGIALAATLREQYPALCIIFISAYRDFDYACKAIELEVKNYIVKSTKYDELINIFTNVKRQLDGQTGLPMADHSLEPEPEIDDRVIQQVIKLINSDLANTTLQRLAESVKLSPVYLSRYFKEKTHVNFVDYVVKKKMEKSRELLSGSEYSIAEISEIVGYSNEKNFSRAFKKHYGVSPSDYRRLI